MLCVVNAVALQKRKKLTDMKSQELRIGNKLNYLTSEGDWTETTIDWQDLKWISEDEKGFNSVHAPIQLNDKWLEKFGMHMPINEGIYSADEAKYDGWSFGFRKVQQTLIDANYSWDCFDFYQDSNGFWFPFLNTYTNINYVHEFQNLYFTLTGNKLKLATAGRSLKAYE